MCDGGRESGQSTAAGDGRETRDGERARDGEKRVSDGESRHSTCSQWRRETRDGEKEGAGTAPVGGATSNGNERRAIERKRVGNVVSVWASREPLFQGGLEKISNF